MQPEYSTKPAVYYGWFIVGTLAWTETISWGVLYYAFAVFQQPIGATMGWSQVQVTGVFSLALLVAGLAAVPAGYWIDRHGARELMAAGSGIATILLLALAHVERLATLYAIWAGVGLCMAAVLYEPAFAVITTWFVRRRGQALAIVTFAAGFASTIFVPLSAALLTHYGWRTALMMLAAALGVGTVAPHALVLRRRPTDIGLAPDGEPRDAYSRRGPAQPARSTSLRTALQSSSFWWLVAAFTLTSLAATATTIHLIPYLTTRGHTTAAAAWATGLIGAMKLPGRALFAPLDARIPRRVLTALLFGLQGVALLVLLLAPSTAGVLVFVVLFGAATGATTLARPALLAERYGVAAYASISGTLALALALAGALAPVGAGALRTGFGSYPPVFGLLALISFVAAVVVFIAMRAP